MKGMRDSYKNLLSEVNGMRDTFKCLALEHYERKLKRRKERKSGKINYLALQIIIAIAFTIVFCIGSYCKARQNSINIPYSPVAIPDKMLIEHEIEY